VVRAGGIVAPVGRQVVAEFAANANLFSSDRFHPSAMGYRVIADALTPCVQAAAAG
jgi:lysophospholipase L1-like esterase